MHYEELREQVLRPAGYTGCRLGWALFARKGMAAWLDAWRGNALHNKTEPALRRGTRVLTGPDQQNELVTVWTGMVLSHVWEGTG